MRLLSRRPLNLTARLAAVTVLLIAISSAAVGVATTLVMREQLGDRLDRQVLASVGRADAGRGDGGRRGDGRGEGGRGDAIRGGDPVGPDDTAAVDVGNQGPGTLVALPDDGEAFILGNRPGEIDDLGQNEIAALGDVPRDGRVHSVHVDGDSYRVTTVDSERGLLVVGLPTGDVDDAVQSLLAAEAVLVLFAVAVAAAVGSVVVRRQLAPLREVAATAHRVAELPLAAGEIDLAERVPARLSDGRTEVGQVGSALNAMLDHVEASLNSRQRSEQQVRQFVADASHELRTPLATIAGYAELARHRPDAVRTALDKVETESARMTSLVEDLLLLARLDAGRPLEQEPVDLSLLLLEAVNDARVLDDSKAWRVVLPDEPVVVLGDGVRLHQVVSNLLTNARKYTPDGTTVTVTGTAAGFSVHDDGTGFPPDLVPQAFERFTRSDASRNRAGGAGLGLSLVDAIVTAHGGTVTLDSRPGDTTLEVRLPRSPGRTT